MAAAMAALTACSMKSEEYEEQMCSMLEEKYGEEFAVAEYLGLERMENRYEAVCYSQAYPDILFEAQAAADGSYLTDEYIAARVCRKIEDKILDNMGSASGYIELKVQAVSKTVNSQDADMSVENFVKMKNGNRFAVYMHYCPVEKNAENVYKSLENSLNGMECLSGNIQLYPVGEETLKAVGNYLTENAKLYHEHDEMVKDVERITIPFENGKIQMEEQQFLKEAGDRL